MQEPIAGLAAKFRIDQHGRSDPARFREFPR
jgi:hypothetical protein